MGGIREATDADRAEAADVAAAALSFDAPEARTLLDHLTSPPPGRRRTMLVDSGGTGVVLGSVSGSDPEIGHVDLIAVRPAARGLGVGRALLEALEAWLRAEGVREVRLDGNPPCYAWPGIDVRYTPALCLAERLGYEQYGIAWNMTADLSADLNVAPDLERLAAAGIEIRSAAAGGRDRTAVAEFVREQWNERWAWEVGRSRGVHYASRDGEVVGFATWGSRPAWFGPMGTAAAAQGMGIGRVLLRRCLSDQRDAGQRTAEIGWVGPKHFYSRAVGARVDRVFVRYRRRLHGGTTDEHGER